MGVGVDGGECGWGVVSVDGVGMDGVVAVDQATGEAWLEEHC